MDESPTVWLDRLKHADDGVRHRAKLALGGLSPADKDAAPELVDALSRGDAETRFWAATALARLRSEARDALPALVERLTDPAFGSRQAAAHALGRIGPEADPAAPALVRTLKADRNGFVRQDVVRALGEIGTPAAGDALAGALDDRDPEVRRCAAVALKALGPKAKGAAPALRRRLAGETTRAVRDQIKAALAIVGVA